MAKKKNAGTSCLPSAWGCCRIESLVSVDDRGQMVLSKALREKAKIRAGDKLAVATWEKNGEVCCIALIKADEFAGMVKDMLGPMLPASK